MDHWRIRLMGLPEKQQAAPHDLTVAVIDQGSLRLV